MTAARWSAVTLAAALVTTSVLALAPVQITRSCQVSSHGPMECSASRGSLLASEGAGVLAVLAVPVVVSLLPMVLRSRRWRLGAALLLTAAVVLAAASVGIFFLPTVLLAWMAVARSPGRRPTVSRR
jgi:hypothetical protein